MTEEPAYLIGGPMHGQVIVFRGGVREFYTAPNTEDMDDFFVRGKTNPWATVDKVVYVPIGRTPEGRMILECREDAAQASEKIPHEVTKYVVQSMKILTEATESYLTENHPAVQRAKYAQEVYLYFLGEYY